MPSLTFAFHDKEWRKNVVHKKFRNGGNAQKSRGIFGGIHKPLLSYEENEDSKKD
jgi:hypothetical protein